MPGGNILHFAAIRVRVVGQGNLRPSFLGYNDIPTDSLSPVAMNVQDFKERRVLSNYTSQIGYLKLETTEFGEVMRVNRVEIFAKQLWTEYPDVD